MTEEKLKKVIEIQTGINRLQKKAIKLSAKTPLTITDSFKIAGKAFKISQKMINLLLQKKLILSQPDMPKAGIASVNQEGNEAVINTKYLHLENQVNSLKEENKRLIGIIGKAESEIKGVVGESDEIKKEAKAVIEKLENELKTTESLLKERQMVLDAIPECSVHGQCVPNALDWIEKMKKLSNS